MKDALKFLVAILLFGVLAVSCSKDDDPQPDPYPTPTPTYPDSPSDGGGNSQQTVGSEILGTWYYANPTKTVKLSYTFSEDRNSLGNVFTKVIESTLPYASSRSTGSWKYSDGKWTFSYFELFGIWGEATVESLNENEMWISVSSSLSIVRRFKFTRSNPGELSRPSGVEIADNNVFLNTRWKVTYNNATVTCSFGTATLTEKSDSKIYIYSSERWETEGSGEYLFIDGVLKVDYSKCLLPNLIGYHHMVVVKNGSNSLKLFHPSAPDTYLILTKQ